MTVLLGIGGTILSAMLGGGATAAGPAAAGGGILGNIAGGGIGGAILMIVIGIIKGIVAKKQACRHGRGDSDRRRARAADANQEPGAHPLQGATVSAFESDGRSSGRATWLY